MLDTFEISSWIQRHLHNSPNRHGQLWPEYPGHAIKFLTPATNKNHEPMTYLWHIRRPLPSLGLGGAGPGITAGVQHS